MRSLVPGQSSPKVSYEKVMSEDRYLFEWLDKIVSSISGVDLTLWVPKLILLSIPGDSALSKAFLSIRNRHRL